jgi:hypothetical protein
MKKLVLFSLLLATTVVTAVSCKKSDCFKCRYLGVTMLETCRDDFNSDAEFEQYKEDNRTANPFWSCN